MSTFRAVAIATLATTVTWAGSASATGVDEASSTGKGIVGGALLGAEAVMLTEAAIGVKPRWAYLVGGGAGAVLAYPEHTPMTNLLLTLLDKVGVGIDRLGDSTGRLAPDLISV
jgi:hypothetical protein